VICSSAVRLLQGQNLQPPFHHAVGLGEEAVAADVDAVAFVDHGAGDSAQYVGFLQHHRMDIGALEQLVGRGQAGGSAANDDRSLFHGSKPDRLPPEPMNCL
jgi:hypothetical protein